MAYKTYLLFPSIEIPINFPLANTAIGLWARRPYIPWVVIPSNSIAVYSWLIGFYAENDS